MQIKEDYFFHSSCRIHYWHNGWCFCGSKNSVYWPLRCQTYLSRPGNWYETLEDDVATRAGYECGSSCGSQAQKDVQREVSDAGEERRQLQVKEDKQYA